MSKEWKGVILAGGSGARLWPLTKGLNKHLLPVYDRPLIYFPLALLFEAGIRQVVIVSTPSARPLIEALLGDGSDYGADLSYLEQPAPTGVSAGLALTRDFVGDGNTVMALGDNVFLGRLFGPTVGQLLRQTEGASVFTTPVANAADFGVVQTRSDGRPMRVVEKPRGGGPGLAIPGLYLFDTTVFEKLAERKLSAKGEWDVTDVLQAYVEENRLRLAPLPSGTQWFDVGTAARMFSATVAVRSGLTTSVSDLGGSPELAACRQGWIEREALVERCSAASGSAYADWMCELLRAEAK